MHHSDRSLETGALRAERSDPKIPVVSRPSTCAPYLSRSFMAAMLFWVEAIANGVEHPWNSFDHVVGVPLISRMVALTSAPIRIKITILWFCLFSKAQCNVVAPGASLLVIWLPWWRSYVATCIKPNKAAIWIALLWADEAWRNSAPSSWRK